MANNVNFTITFHAINDKAKATLDEMLKRVRTDGDYQWMADMFVDGKELTYEQSEQYTWTTEHIGPKWCYFEEIDDNYLMGVSAWSAPETGLQNLLNILAKDDPTMITSISYTDEAPNFFGYSVYYGDNMEDGREDDDDELRDSVIRASNDLAPDDWEEDNMEWVDEEKEDIYYQEMWEVIDDIQVSGIDEVVEGLMELRKEEQSPQNEDDLVGC